MKRIITFTIIMLSLTACTVFRVNSEPVATDESQVNMPNPAAAYCEQNGYEYEIHTADDGSQSGVCEFPDGSACDEWAYYRGECSPGAQASSTPAIAVEATTKVSGGGPGGSSDTGEDGSGGFMPSGTTEEIADWWGVIKSTEPGAQYDDYFERQDLGQVIYFGIDSMDPAVQAQIEALRDSGKIVHIYGTLFSNVPDYNGSQVQVDRIEVEG
jgi:putative hemolysin